MSDEAELQRVRQQSPIDYGLFSLNPIGCPSDGHSWTRPASHPNFPEGVPCDCGLVLYCDLSVFRFTPTGKGKAGASDARKHLVDHAPAFVLTALGDALLAMRDKDAFSSDEVRALAGPTVDAWLTAEKVRRNTFSGWFMTHAKLHKLVRVGSRKSTRADARGRMTSLWRFPASLETP